jgi:translation initiation factor IF-3
MSGAFCVRHFFYCKGGILIYYNNQNNQRPEKNTDLVNELIRFPEVLVIGPNGESLGVLSRGAALRIASEQYSLDLLCVAPMAKPPVCKIVNYGKLRFEKQKQAKEAKKNQNVVELKEIRMTPVIDTHDLETKANAAIKFFNAGHKVKVSIKFRGRQLAHIDVGEKVMNDFIALVQEVSVIEKKPFLDGKFLNAILAAKIKK